MKNQYFGDKRDFFKYDLAIELCERIPLKQLTFIPMLTENDGTEEGKFTNYDCKSMREDLYVFLQNCVKNGKRNIKELKKYFNNITFIKYTPYGENIIFTHEGRKAYFRDIPQDALKDSVILIDPDNGIEIKSMGKGNGHKYIKFSEIKSLWEKMSDNSILVIFQFMPRVTRKEYFNRMWCALKEKLEGCVPTYISDNQIVLLILPKHDKMKVQGSIEAYAEKNNLLIRAIIRGFADAGIEPAIMGFAPAQAIKNLLRKLNLKIEDIDFFEINEAFASQCLAVIKDLSLDPSRVNVNGGAIALGHPVGSSGVRIVLTLIRELKKRNKKLGVASLCSGGGQGNAVCIEVV